MIDYKISKLSVLARAAKAYAEGKLQEVKKTAELLYPDGVYPFAIYSAYPLPLHLFSPRLAAMLLKDEDHLKAVEMWDILTTPGNIIRMITSTELKRTAAESLGNLLESRYKLDTEDQKIKRKQMVGYMIKVLMECYGYLVFGGRMQICTFREGADKNKRRTNYFTTATRYSVMTKTDRDKFLKDIPESHKDAFIGITNHILSVQKAYQKQYDIDVLIKWGSVQGLV